MKRKWIEVGLGLVVLGLSASGAVAQKASVITRPDWTQIPTGDEIGSLYPERAIREGVSGKATLTCAVTVDGLLTECTAVENAPGGYGFDAAALAMTASFRMKPQTRDGQPVAGGAVTIPIVFKVPEGPPMGPAGMRFGDGTIIVSKIDAAASEPHAPRFPCPDGQGQCVGHIVKWIDRPDAVATSDILKRSEQIEGLALADCVIAADGRLQDCDIHRAASPAADTAVKEALALMRAGPATEDGEPTAGAHVQIPFQWDWLIAGVKRGS